MCNYFSVADKNLPKTLCKNSPKTPQKSSKKPQWVDKNLLYSQKLLQSFNKILAKNF
jgi:hypothetical protein